MCIRDSFITADATGPKHLETTLTRAKFNEMTADLVEATMGPVRQALSDSGLKASDLNKILLVGAEDDALWDTAKSVSYTHLTKMPDVTTALCERIGQHTKRCIS